ncbi:MAG: hypothetical protein ACTSWQ_01525 [Candidatus Thorarchaeota archaeon]
MIENIKKNPSRRLRDRRRRLKEKIMRIHGTSNGWLQTIDGLPLSHSYMTFRRQEKMGGIPNVLETTHRDEVLELMTELYDRGYRYCTDIAHRIEMTKAFGPRLVRVIFSSQGYMIYIDPDSSLQTGVEEQEGDCTPLGARLDFKILGIPKHLSIRELIAELEILASSEHRMAELYKGIEAFPETSWTPWVERIESGLDE